MLRVTLLGRAGVLVLPCFSEGARTRRPCACRRNIGRFRRRSTRRQQAIASSSDAVVTAGHPDQTVGA